MLDKGESCHFNASPYIPPGPPGLGQWYPGSVMSSAIGQETSIPALEWEKGQEPRNHACSLKPTWRPQPHYASHGTSKTSGSPIWPYKGNFLKIQKFVHIKFGDQIHFSGPRDPGRLPTHNASLSVGIPKRKNVQDNYRPDSL